jgi:O-antigen/teichoic acid export membrane protein
VTDGQPGSANPDLAALDQFRRWARFLFAILALVAAVGVVLVAIGVGLVPARLAAVWPLVLILAANLAATLIVLVSLFRGLGRWSPWALHAVVPVCGVLIAIGVARTLIALTQNSVMIPLEAIGALLVLTRPHGPDTMPPATAEDRRRGTVAAGVMFASYFVPLVLPLSLAG